jgi:drug/metabolite transporter (DMT)-like permease
MNARSASLAPAPSLARAWTGPLLVLGFTALTAMKGVYLGALLQHHDPARFLAATFTVVTVFFAVVAARRPRRWQLDRAALRSMAKLNATTALSWLAYAQALRYLEPAVAGAWMAGVGPLVTLGLASHVGAGGRARVGAHALIPAVGVLVGLGLLAATTLSGKSALGSGTHLGLGLAFALASGVAMVGNTLFAKELADRGLRATEVMSVRFLLLLVVAYAIARANPASADDAVGIGYVARALVVAGIGLVGPLYLLQRGIERSDPLTVALIVATMPLFALVAELGDHRLVPSAFSFVAVAVTAAFSFAGTVLARGRS